MSLKVIKPSWDRAGAGGLRVAREGTVLLEFAAAKGPQQYDWERKEVRVCVALLCCRVCVCVSLLVGAAVGEGREGGPAASAAAAPGLSRRRRRRPLPRPCHALQTIALSAVECAAVLDATDARQGVDFYHDPNKGGAQEGQISKTLRQEGARGGWCGACRRRRCCA